MKTYVSYDVWTWKQNTRNLRDDVFVFIMLFVIVHSSEVY